MSKKTKTASSEKRAKDKRAKKATNKARYAAMRDSGLNSKSYRAKRNAAGAKKIRIYRNRIRSKRMSDVTAQPLIHATGEDMTGRSVMVYTEQKMTWRQVHNQITVKPLKAQSSRKEPVMNKKRERRLQRRAERNGLAG